MGKNNLLKKIGIIFSFFVMVLSLITLKTIKEEKKTVNAGSVTDNIYWMIENEPEPGSYNDKYVLKIYASQPSNWYDVEGNFKGSFSGSSVFEYNETQTWLSTFPGWKDNTMWNTCEIVDNITPASLACWFTECNNLNSITGLDKIDMSQCTSTASMFRNCPNLKAIDLSGLNVSTVTDMSNMFCLCTMESLNISTWNTSNVTNMSTMFSSSKVHNLNLGSFNTANVTDYTGMFNGFTTDILDISNFTLKSGATLNNMFDSCYPKRLKISKAFNEKLNTTGFFVISGWHYYKEIGGTDYTTAANMASASIGTSVDWFIQQKVTLYRYVSYGGKTTYKDNIEVGVKYGDTFTPTVTHQTMTNCTYDNTYTNNSNYGNPTNATYEAYSLTNAYTAGEITADKKLYMKFEPQTYAITYKDKNDATYSGSNTPAPTAHAYGMTTTLSNEYANTKTGYTFKGWYETSDCSGSKVTTIGGTDKSAAFTLYADWTPITYTVKYYKNHADATGSMSDQTMTYDVDANLTTCGFTRPGYKFDGWYPTSGCSGSLKYTDGQSVKNLRDSAYSVCSMYAKWVPAEYTITYLNKGGSALTCDTNTSPTKHTYNTATTLVDPTRTGYTFKGWYTTSDCSGTAVSSLGATAYTADITLYASWQGTPYAINYFDKDGNTFSGTHEDGYPTIHYFEDDTTLDTPTKTGYTFDGWFTSSDCTGTAITKVDGSVTAVSNLYAKWSETNYTITYNLNNGQDPSNPSSYTITSSTITLTNPTRPGCNFKGWSGTGLTGNTNKNVTIPSGSTGDMTFTANWTLIDYDIIYVLDDGENSGTNPINYNVETATITLADPTKVGNEFTGWTTSGVTTPTKGLTIDLGSTGVKEFTAHWKPNEYNISYKDKGDVAFTGTHGSDYPQKHTYGTATTLVSPTKTGYTFDGWFTAKACTGTAITQVGATSKTDNFTLYAKWTPIEYTISYADENDAAFSGTHGNSYPTAHTYDTATTLVSPSKTGYDFIGWHYLADCSDSVVTSIGATDKTSNFTLYAEWELHSYTITYYNKGGNTFDGVHEAGYPTTHTYTSETTLDEPTKAGYTFKGYYDNSACTGTPITSFPANTKADNIVLYAKFQGEEYSIQYYNKDEATFDGTHGSDHPTAHYYGDSTTLVSPSKTGWDFLGWYTSSDCTSGLVTVLGATDYTAGPIKLYAKWEISVYDITYKDNGDVTFTGSHGASYPTTHTYDTATTLVSPSKTGYNFLGWFDTSSCSGTALTTIGATDKTADFTLYAKWEKITYTYTITPNNGEEPSINNYYVDDLNIVIMNPQKTGYTFSYWSGTGITGTSTTSLSIPNGSTGNKEFEAHWTVNTYNISYLDKGGSALTCDTNASPVTHTYDQETTLIQPTRSGYKFLGWFDTSDCSGTALTTIGATDKTADFTLYAKWGQILTITYQDQNAAFSGTHGQDNPVEHVIGVETTLVTPTKTGYNFLGWYDDVACSGSPITTIGASDKSANFTLYAKWELQTYTITYKDCGDLEYSGEGNTNSVTHTYETATNLVNVSKTGYNFLGWYEDSSCTGSPVTVIGATAKTANFTLYAKWEALVFDITYQDENDVAFSGTLGENSPSKHTYGSTTTLVKATKNNYRFVGWFTASNCSGSPITNINGNDFQSNITLYAKWVDKSDVEININFKAIKIFGDSNIEYSINGSNLKDFVIEYLVDGVWTSKAPVNAGKYDIRITRNEDDDYKSFSQIISDGLIIEKANIDMSNVKWDYTKAFTYDGSNKTVQLINLPNGVSVKYENNTNSKVGDYIAKATFVYDSANYNPISVEDLKWEIRNTTIDSSEDGKTNVVISTENGFSNDIQLVVEVIAEVNVEQKELIVDLSSLKDTEFLEKNEKVGVVFDVKLLQTVNGVTTEIKDMNSIGLDKIKVKMLIPEEVDITKVTKILHIHAADDIEIIEFDASKIVDGYYEIEISKLSEFAFVYKNNSSLWWLWIIVIIIVLLITLYICKKQKEKKLNEKKTNCKKPIQKKRGK